MRSWSACWAWCGAVEAEVHRRVSILLGVLVLLGTGLRVWGSLDEFWLDEIWSLRMVSSLPSPLGILTRLTHDNNHPLNSLFLWLVEPTSHWTLYRTLAVAASVGALVLTVLLSRGRPPREAVTSVALMALSYPLVVYGSEARGYAPAMFFALAAFALLERARRPGAPGALGLFWSALVAGFLSHLTFAFVLVSLVLLSINLCLREGSGLRGLLASSGRLVAAPLLVTAALYYPYLRGFGFGDAPGEAAPAVLRQWMTLLGGAPRDGIVGTLSAIVIACFLAYGIWRAWRDGDADWVFFLGILALPPLSVVVLRPPFLLVRYFVLTIPFLLLLLARAVGAGPRGRWVAAALLIVALAGNVAHIAAFLRIGRGHYLEAVDYMLTHTQGPDVSVTSDHDFRNRMMLGFYVPRGGLPKKVIYTSLSALPPEGTEWLIRHSLERDPRLPAETQVGSLTYRLEYRAPFFGELSGFHWFLYRRDDRSRTERGGPGGEAPTAGDARTRRRS